MELRQPNRTIWQSYVWHEGRCFFVSTIERNFATYAGNTRGPETLVWAYDWENNRRTDWLYQAAGVSDHQAICRSLIATGKPEACQAPESPTA